jgi:hypothetical protein
MSFSISGNAGIAGALVSWTGPSSGSVTADSLGNYLIGGLAPGVYTITPSHAGRAFNPASQFVTVSNINIVAVSFQAVSTSTPASGFTSSFIGQNEGGLNIYVGPGQIMGTRVNGQVVAVPANSTTYVWVDNSGNILTGAALPGSGAYGIAIVISGQLQTSGSGETSPGGFVTSNAILSIEDIRTS